MRLKLQKAGLYTKTEHRTVKYLNNLIEQDHRPIKRRNKFYRSYAPPQQRLKAWKRFAQEKPKEGTLFGFSVCTEIKVLLGIPA